MKKIIILLFVCLFILCTENARVKNFGGKMNLELKPHEKLINITWKQSDMWVLTEDIITKIKYFREQSSFGIWQGEIIIK